MLVAVGDGGAQVGEEGVHGGGVALADRGVQGVGRTLAIEVPAPFVEEVADGEHVDARGQVEAAIARTWNVPSPSTRRPVVAAIPARMRSAASSVRAVSST